MKGYINMKMFLKINSFLCIFLLSTAIFAQNTSFVIPAHEPITVSVNNKDAVLLFLKPNVESYANSSSATSESDRNSVPIEIHIVNLSSPMKMELVTDIGGTDKSLESAFVYDSIDGFGKSAYLIFGYLEGKNLNSYHVLELSIIDGRSGVEILPVPARMAEPQLQNCLDGKDENTGEVYACPYKTEEGVKEYIRQLYESRK